MTEATQNASEVPMTRQITSHHTAGLDELTDLVTIEADEQDPRNGNGSHCYRMRLGGVTVGMVQFQHGPRTDASSTPGVTSLALLAVILDHLQTFQSGEFKNRENALAITAIEEARNWMLQRTFDRRRRNVLGERKA
jgi:hypothetical protein